METLKKPFKDDSMSGRRKNILIRADASATLGVGHVARCMTLQQALQDLGFGIIFVSRELTGHLNRQIIENGGSVRFLEPAAGELEALRNLIVTEHAGALILDGYHFDSVYLKELSATAIPLILLDDLNDRGPLPVSLIINSLPHARHLGYDKTAPEATLLAGLDYALLRPEFHRPDGARVHASRRSRLLINFGGSDPLNLSLPLARALLEQEASLPITLITGSGYRHPDEVCTLAARYADLCHIHNCTDMAHQFLQAGLALAAPGSTVYELAACHVPAVFLICADNQVLSAGAHEKLGWCRVFDGRDPEQRQSAIISTLKLWHNPRRRDELQKKTSGLITARGPGIVARQIRELVNQHG